jgi:hypothetical protein
MNFDLQIFLLLPVTGVKFFFHKRHMFHNNNMILVKFVTGIGSSSPLLSIKIVHLVDRADLFKVRNLIYGGRKL